MEEFLGQYLEHLYERFSTDTELNNIKDYFKNVKNVKKDDDSMTMLTKMYINKFTPINILTEENIKEEDAQEIYTNYKTYKERWYQPNDYPKYINDQIIQNDMIDTSETFYIRSIDVRTEQLVSVFGPLRKTGRENDNYRYEYKFEMVDTQVVFSVYDWVDEDRKFENEEDIVWHVASNTDDESFLQIFLWYLKDVCS